MDPCAAGPDLVATFALMCRLLIFVFCFAIGIFVTAVCGAVWILAKISTSIEEAHDTTIPEEPGEAGGEITTPSSSFQPADLPVEAAYWKVMTWVRKQGILQLSQQDGDEVLECVAEPEPEPEPQTLAHGAAREAWAMHAVCPHCHDRGGDMNIKWDHW